MEYRSNYFCLCTGIRPYNEPISRRIYKNKINYDSYWKDKWFETIIKKDWDLFWNSHFKKHKKNV